MYLSRLSQLLIIGNNDVIPFSDVSVNTSWAQTVEESGTGEDQEESSGLNTDTVDAPHDVPSAGTNEEEQFKAEEKQLDHTNRD